MKKLFLLFVLIAFKTFSQGGSYDASFGTNGIASYCQDYLDSSNNIDGGMQSTGKIVMYNYNANNPARLIRWNANGSLDTTFGVNGVIDLPLTSPFMIGNYYTQQMIIQPDDKIIIMGLQQGNTYPNSYWVVRLLPNGGLDTSFNGSGYLDVLFGTLQDRGYCVGLQPDGKIIVGGTSGNTGQYFTMARLLSNGSFDTSFGTNGKVQTLINGEEAFARSILVQPDGKIILGGHVGSVSQAKDFAMIRYHTNGSVDTSFGTAGKVITTLSVYSDIILSMFIEPNGKIVAGGTYSYESNPHMAMARYNSNGTIDNSFGTNGIVVDMYSNQPNCSITRQIDGKIIMASGYDGIYFYLSRYTINGVLDNSFGTNGVVNVFPVNGGYVGKVFIQPDNKIVATGASISNTNQTCPTVVRLNPGALGVAEFENDNVVVYPNPTSGVVYFDISKNEFEKVSVYNYLGQEVMKPLVFEEGNNTAIDLSGLSNGVYLLRFEGNGKSGVARVVKK